MGLVVESALFEWIGLIKLVEAALKLTGVLFAFGFLIGWLMLLWIGIHLISCCNRNEDKLDFQGGDGRLWTVDDLRL